MRRATLQSTYTRGELDPDLSERTDLEHYYNSLASALNSVFHPQGGFSDRGGFELVSDAAVLASGAERRLRNRIVPVIFGTANLTAANGGSTANLVDQNGGTLFTTNAVTAAPFVVVEIDLLTAQRIDFVDLEGVRAELAGADECLAIEYWTGTGWMTFADAIGVPAAKHIRTTSRTRRFGTTPGGPGGVPVVARQWRVVARTGVGSIGRISIAGLRLWKETDQLCPTHVREIARDRGTTHEVVIGERNVDVFVAQRYVASIPLMLSAQQVDEAWFTGGFDTMIVFHELLETQRVIRQGSISEWDVGPAPFTNVPTLVESVMFSGAQDEIQQISLEGLASGTQIVLFLAGQHTPPITYTTPSAMPSLIKTALQSLVALASGANDLAVDQIGSAAEYAVRFTGANGLRAFPLLSVLAMSGASVPATTVLQVGLAASGAYMSSTTGWPRCGVVVQQRLFVAGFRAAPTSYLFSTNPNIWNFNTGTDPITADMAFRGALDVKDVEVITGVYLGRHLQVFTEVAEYYGETRTLDATQPINFVRSTAHGAARGVPFVFADGATLFMQQGGMTLRDYLFTDAEAAYGAEPLTVLSPQVLNGVVDMAHRKARDVRDGNLIFLVNGDGTAGVVTLLRKQNVIAGAPWRTFGRFKSMMVSITHDVYAVIERSGAHWLEKWTPDWPLDWATHSVGAPRTVIEGAGYLEGRSDVWVIADGDVIGPVTVSTGVITLDEPASDVRYGLMPEWRAQSQVLREKLQNSQPFRGPARIYEMEFSVKSTGQLMLGTNGGALAEVPMIRTEAKFRDGGPLQTATGGDPTLPMYDRLYTGNVLMTGLLGIAEYPYWEVSRTVPAPVHIKSARIEVAHRGDQFSAGGG